MASLFHLLLLSLLLLPFCSCVDPVTNYCAKNYISFQTQASISQVLSSLVAKASATGFATATAGYGDNTIYGLAQCRGDISASDCSRCIAAAAKELPTVCPAQADARIWYDYCFMRYDSSNFIGLPDTGYTLILINTQNASDPEAFDKAESKLMSQVAAEVAVPASEGLAREKAKFTQGVTIYGLAWCTRDIHPADCGLCVSQAVAQFPDYCRFRRGCRVLYSSCMARYETYPFFFPLDQSSSSTVGEEQYDQVILHP